LPESRVGNEVQYFSQTGKSMDEQRSPSDK
jgi:hypothetical protein